MIARSELEAEVAMLRRELASITASGDRSRDLAARLEDESHELKSRIESAKYEEERDRKTAEELEEELANLADEVNGQLDELERINGTGGGGMGRVGKALLRSASSYGSASFGDAASVGGRSRASSAGGSLVDEVQSRFEDACSVGDGTLDNTVADEISVRSRGTRDGTTVNVLHSKHSSGRSSSNTRHPSTGRPASALQQQWEAAHSNSAEMPERPTRSTSRGSTGYESGDRTRRFANQSRREEEQGGLAASRSSRSSGRTTRSYMSSMASSTPSSPDRGPGRTSDVDRRRETFRDSAADGDDMNDSWRARQKSLTTSFHSLFQSLGQEVDQD